MYAYGLYYYENLLSEKDKLINQLDNKIDELRDHLETYVILNNYLEEE